MISISVKEILFLALIVGGIIWFRMARESVEAGTHTIIRKLRGPTPGQPGFSWRAVVIAFLIGMACCCLFALAVLRITQFFAA